VSRRALATDRGGDAVELGRLYRRYKALAISVGASLALRRQPADALQEVRDLAAEAERAGAQRRGRSAERFDACREAAARLGDVLSEAERDSRAPSRQGLNAARASHRRLRRLVWEIVDCEYVPCAAPGATRGQDLDAASATDLKGAHNA
jgi:hypothetical protein